IADLSITDCGLPTADLNPQSIRNPQSAIRNSPFLEAVPDPEANLPFRIEGHPVIVSDCRNLAKRAGGHVVLRVLEYAAVEQVSDFDARFQPSLTAYREDPEHRQIEVVAARSVELVAPGVAEPNTRRLRKRARIEIRAVRSDVVKHGVGTVQVRRLLVAGRIDRCAVVGGHRKWLAGERREHSVELPIARQRVRNAAVAAAFTLPR